MSSVIPPASFTTLSSLAVKVKLEDHLKSPLLTLTELSETSIPLFSISPTLSNTLLNPVEFGTLSSKIKSSVFLL